MRTRSNFGSADIFAEQLVSDQVLLNERRFQASRNSANDGPTHDRPQDDPLHPINSLRPAFHAQRPALLPAIRLYMHLVELALPIFHTMIHRAPTLLQREDPCSSRTWQFLDALNELTSEQRKHTHQYLGRLGQVVDWTVADTGGAGNIEGRTDTRWDRSLRPFGLLGFGSTITISAELVRRIETAQDTATQQWASFQLAVAMLHELAHAVEYAVLPHEAGQQVYLGQAARTTEIGFEVEAIIFGGRISWLEDWGRTAGKAVLWGWPDVRTAQAYLDAGHGIQVRGTPKQLAKSWMVLWKVDSEFWEALFEDQYWTEEVASQGTRALHPHTSVGVLELSRDLTKIEEQLMKVELGLEEHELKDILSSYLRR